MVLSLHLSKGSMRYDGSRSAVASGLTFDMTAISGACNTDERFTLSNWEESPESVGILLDTPAFAKVLSNIGPNGIPPSLSVVVSAIYSCRAATNKPHRIPKPGVRRSGGVI